MGRKEAPAEGAGSGGYSQDLGGGYFGIDQQGHSQSGRDMQDLGHGQDGWNMGRNLQELEHGQAGDRSWNFELGTGGQAQNMGQGFEQNFELFRDVGRHPLEDGALGLVQTSEQRLHGHEQTGGRPQNMEHGAGGQSQNTGQRLQEHRHSQPGGQYQNISQRPRDNGHQNVGRRATEHAKPRGDNPPKRRKQTGPGPRGKNTKPRAKSSQPTPTIAIQEIIDLCQDDDESVKPEPGLLESDHSGQNWTQTNRGRAQNSRPQTRGPPHVPSTLEANSEVGASGIMGIAVNKLGAQNEKLMKELGNVNHELQYKSRMLDQAEAKIVELTNSLETRNKVKAEISNQISTMRKFLDGVGSDYDRLNHMNIEWRNKLKEATTEKMIIEQDLAEVRVALQKANFDAQAWNNGKADAQSIQAELVELRIHAERTEKELGDRAGNLAEARNRVQELEAKILDDRKANRVIVESFQETKAHLVDTLVELQKTMFEKFQDGDATRTDRQAHLLWVLTYI